MNGKRNPQSERATQSDRAEVHQSLAEHVLPTTIRTWWNSSLLKLSGFLYTLFRERLKKCYTLHWRRSHIPVMSSIFDILQGYPLFSVIDILWILFAGKKAREQCIISMVLTPTGADGNWSDDRYLSPVTCQNITRQVVHDYHTATSRHVSSRGNLGWGRY